MTDPTARSDQGIAAVAGDVDRHNVPRAGLRDEVVAGGREQESRESRQCSYFVKDVVALDRELVPPRCGANRDVLVERSVELIHHGIEASGRLGMTLAQRRSEEHTSELQSHHDIV